jgi:tRNA pseudouridine38-40 synthase
VKIKLVIAYDGAAYQGWQVQKIGTGVQQKVEEALAKLFPTKLRLHSSSRTDTGVHALGMVAHFEVEPAQFKMEMRKLPLALNAWLPEDIRIVSAARAGKDFHARFSATAKEYRYFIWNAPTMNPLLRGSAWHVPRSLNLQAMQEAAKAFVGTHDFRSFAANPGYRRETSVRTLSRCALRKSAGALTVVIQGDGFLYKMCRGIVGTLVQVGLGKIPADAIKTILERQDRRVAGMSAPAHGLVLWRSSTPNSKMRIVLIEPEIPPNTGNVARLCAATNTELHLVEPFGFKLDDAQLKRAGMDYWHQVHWRRWPSWREFTASILSPGARLWFVESGGTRLYTEAHFGPNDYLVFGRETAGLPNSLLQTNREHWVRIPMFNPRARSLNLSNCVALVLFEALRQQGFPDEFHR